MATLQSSAVAEAEPVTVTRQRVDAFLSQVQSIRKPEVDGWDLQGRRITVPVVQEPGAGIRITSTEGS